ncbi:tetrapeptide repeat homeobox protein 2-like [Canis lupus baileyi]|uniref:tetrapeptide repeat homeobox protein 2-like n=1 Tax=Canis lupus dingo TaxID=286419 RepID=UPI0015F182B6|nr:tetrapeptide repeat homeobox protein 2-like [Canis lupus dingo]XP_038509591.1 tetra-peptide repeat homeobox protein 1-like [Canis lupus familiaris]
MQEPGSPSGPGLTPNLRKTRRDRTVYLKEQLQELERHFMTNQYPSYQERLALAARLHLEEHQVQVWFKNRRAKHSRLQGLPNGRGRGACAVPMDQGPPTPESVLAPVPTWARVPVPAGPAFPGDPGISSSPVHSPALTPQAAEPSVSSLGPTRQVPGQGSQGHIPAAQAPVPALDPTRPQGSSASDFPPDPMLAPDFTELLSPRDPLEGPPFPLMSGY